MDNTKQGTEKEPITLTGVERAAILINLLPDSLRREIMAGLDKDEKFQLAKILKDRKDYTEEAVQNVMTNFISYMNNGVSGISGGPEYIYNMFKDDMNEEELEEFMRMLFYNESLPFEKIKKMPDVKPLITILQKEDPQTIAIVTSHLKPVQASQLMQALPQDKMTKVALAIAQLDQPNQDVVLELESEINRMLTLFVSDEKGQTDGIKALVDIINGSPRNVEKAIFSFLDEENKEIADAVRDRLFIFEDIAKLEAKDVMAIIGEISEDGIIAKALRGAPEEIKVLFMNGMSEGKKERVADADSVLGKIKIREVEEAQQEIANIAKRLEKDGKITISRGEDDVIL